MIFLLRKADAKIAVKVLDMFRFHSRIEMIIVNGDLFGMSCELMRKYKISLGDSSMIAMMKNKDIDTIYSFDSGIDGIPEITRKENV